MFLLTSLRLSFSTQGSMHFRNNQNRVSSSCNFQSNVCIFLPVSIKSSVRIGILDKLKNLVCPLTLLFLHEVSAKKCNVLFLASYEYFRSFLTQCKSLLLLMLGLCPTQPSLLTLFARAKPFSMNCLCLPILLCIGMFLY